MKFFENIPVGESWQVGNHTFDAAEIKRFASAYDPQPFHMDEAAAAESHFGALCASGWHTLAVWMQLNVREWQRRARELELAGVPAARLGPSPGFEDLKWLKPVYAGDTISFASEVVAKKDSASRPGWGLVSFRNTGRNQHGEDAIVFTAHVFVQRHNEAPAEVPDPAMRG